jgi:K+/H+ antiporter YhaU regulatory subunit KhtT
MGSVEELRQAETLLRQFQKRDHVDESADNFVVAEISIAPDSRLVGQTLAEIRFRQRHGVTVVGIRRGENQMMIPTATGCLAANDRLMVMGDAKAVELLKQRESL